LGKEVAQVKLGDEVVFAFAIEAATGGGSQMVEVGKAAFAPTDFYGAKTLEAVVGFCRFGIGREDQIVVVEGIESHSSNRCNKSNSSYDVDRKRGPRPQYFRFSSRIPTEQRYSSAFILFLA
jgi:hypothetical protein